MQGLILAAGRGTRLGRLGESTPKPLLTLPTGETLVTRLIRQMFEAGATTITVVVGHMAGLVTGRIRTDFPDAQIEFVTAHDFSTTNNVVSMLIGLTTCRQSATPGDGLIFAECDVLLGDGTLSDVVALEYPNVAVVSPFAAGMDGTVVSLAGSTVSEIIPPRLQSARFPLEDFYKTVNVYLFNWQSWASRLPQLLRWQIEEVGTSDYYENALGMIVYALQNEMYAHVIPQLSWHEIDDLNDLRVAQEKIFPGHDVGSVMRTHGGWWDLPYLDFAYLRNMHFPPANVFSQISQALPALLQNYGSSQQRVDEKLSWLLNVDSANLVALPGLSVIYPQLSAMLDNERTWIPEQTFGEYLHRFPRASRYADSAWATLLTNGDVNNLVLVNPNNPTGALISTEEVLLAARNHPATRFFVDESFISFTREPSLLSIEHLPPNILLARSMSKELGMPGLRLGFVYSTNTDLIQKIRSAQPVWALNSIAEFAITLLLKFRKEYQQSLEHFWDDKAKMLRLLSAEPGVRVLDNVEGSFLLVNLEHSLYPDLLNALGGHRILVKDLSARFVNESAVSTIRLAVRPSSDVELLIDALRNIRSQSAADGMA